HSGKVVITLGAETMDERGMGFDFADIKRVVATCIDENLDHRMILCRQDPVVPLSQAQTEPLFLLDENPTAETIAKLIFDKTLEAGFPIIEARLWETPKCFATYSR